MNKYLVSALTGALVFTLSCTVFAQEEKQEEKKEEMKYSYGTVTQINESTNEIVINEYDLDNYSEVTVTYSVDPEAKFENVSSLKEISPDTDVDIEYVEKEDGKKIAKIISVYKEELEPELPEPAKEIPAAETETETGY